MKVLLQPKKHIESWLKKMMDKVIYFAKKNVRKLKGKPPEKTAWEIINLLA